MRRYIITINFTVSDESAANDLLDDTVNDAILRVDQKDLGQYDIVMEEVDL